MFCHVLTLVRGYSGDVTLTHSRLSITITERRSLVKLFSPSRFSVKNFVTHRHFKKVPSKSGNKSLSVFNGRSLVVVTRNTPLKMDNYMKTERLAVTFYVLRYTKNDFPVYTSL